ncbi:MAG: hypothetical protein J2P26_13915, partial [Nocardiopsaceae bacterium]|nr:hypothetical protein [Nocardiopsaceae bacterium]
WEVIMKAERASVPGAGPASALDGVPFGQPALSLAAQLQRRAERAGIQVLDGSGPDGSGSAGSGPDGSGPGSGPAGSRSAGGGAEGDIGAELMRVVAKARAAGVDPELALREAARSYADQVREAERSRSA